MLFYDSCPFVVIRCLFDTESQQIAQSSFKSNSAQGGLRWNLKEVWIYITLMAKDIEHFSEYILAICFASFEGCLIWG